MVKIQKFDENGKFLGILTRSTPEEGDPWDIIMWCGDMEIDKDGNLYVIARGEILKFDEEGRLFLMSFGGFGKDPLGEDVRPIAIAIDKDGNLYITTGDPDSDYYRVKKFTNDGKFILSFGRKGKDPGEFESPSGIAIDGEGNVYVADTGNHRIQKFTKDGKFILAFGEYLETHPYEVMKIYFKEVLRKDPATLTLTEEESRKLDREIKEYYRNFLLDGGAKFYHPLGIAANF
jgi:DNA-binding beta-propeller fold protein YncE